MSSIKKSKFLNFKIHILLLLSTLSSCQQNVSEPINTDYKANMTGVRFEKEEVEIPDLNLREEIKKIMHLDEKTPIRTEDALKIEKLEFNSTKVIYNLKGLEYFKNLKVLKIIPYLDLNDLDLTMDMSKIIWEKNEVNDLRYIEKLDKLEELSLKDNYIKNLNSISLLPNLRDLDLEYNKLFDISGLEKLTKLEYLNLSNNNQIMDYSPLYKHPNLEVLKKADESINYLVHWKREMFKSVTIITAAFGFPIWHLITYGHLGLPSDYEPKPAGKQTK